METWRSAMPEGMHLKSDGFASSLFAPNAGATLGDYCRGHDIDYDDERFLVRLETFIDYGLDFQRRYVPDVDQRNVVSLRRQRECFELTLDDETVIAAEKVILAVGITHFGYTPPVLARLPAAKVMHSSALSQVTQFAGRDVIVVGAGSSAVDLAVLLSRCGAKTRLLARGDAIRFDTPPSRAGKRSYWRRLRHPKSGLGPGLRSWLYCSFPRAFRLMPDSIRIACLHRHLGPKSQYHLRQTIERDVPVMLNHEIVQAEATDDGVRLSCRNGAGELTTVETEFVIAATGYRADCERLAFIDPKLRSAIESVDGYPRLSSCFESSAPGLYFVGLAAAGSFGPLMRFVYGVEYAAKRLGMHLR